MNKDYIKFKDFKREFLRGVPAWQTWKFEPLYLVQCYTFKLAQIKTGQFANVTRGNQGDKNPYNLRTRNQNHPAYDGKFRKEIANIARLLK